MMNDSNTKQDHWDELRLSLDDNLDSEVQESEQPVSAAPKKSRRNTERSKESKKTESSASADSSDNSDAEKKVVESKKRKTTKKSVKKVSARNKKNLEESVSLDLLNPDKESEQLDLTIGETEKTVSKKKRTKSLSDKELVKKSAERGRKSVQKESAKKKLNPVLGFISSQIEQIAESGVDRERNQTKAVSTPVFGIDLSSGDFSVEEFFEDIDVIPLEVSWGRKPGEQESGGIVRTSVDDADEEDDTQNDDQEVSAIAEKVTPNESGRKKSDKKSKRQECRRERNNENEAKNKVETTVSKEEENEDDDGSLLDLLKGMNEAFDDENIVDQEYLDVMDQEDSDNIAEAGQEEAVGEERRRSRRNRRHGRKNRNAVSEELPPVLKEEKLSRNDEDFAGDDPFSSVVEYESEVPERGRRSKHGRRNHSGESQSNMEQKKMAGKPFGYSDDPESSLVDAEDVEEQESVSKPIKPSIPKSMPSWEDAVSCVVRFNMNRRGQRKKK